MFDGGGDALSLLLDNAKALLDEGYYDNPGTTRAEGLFKPPSMVAALERHPSMPVIAEVKKGSPSDGKFSTHGSQGLISEYVRGGAAALSVLSEPNHFHGSLRNVVLAARSGLPVLMKDIIIDGRQLECARMLNASAVLLIESAFGGRGRNKRDKLIGKANDLGLEVVLECSAQEELDSVLDSRADMLAFNRRDLRTLSAGGLAMEDALPDLVADGRPVLAMSLMRSRNDVEKARDLGAAAVLIGKALSSSPCPRRRLKDLKVGR